MKGFIKNALCAALAVLLCLAAFTACSGSSGDPTDRKTSSSAGGSTTQPATSADTSGSSAPSEPTDEPTDEPTATPTETAEPTIPPYEGEKVVFSLESAEAKAGETFTVNLSIVYNSGFAGYSVSVLYDTDKLEVVKVENKIKGGFSTYNNTVAGAVRLMCTKAGYNPITETGVCDEITFKVKDGTAAGTTDLTLSLRDASDLVYCVSKDFTSYPKIESEFVNGSVTIVA